MYGYMILFFGICLLASFVVLGLDLRRSRDIPATVQGQPAPAE